MMTVVAKVIIFRAPEFRERRKLRYDWRGIVTGNLANVVFSFLLLLRSVIENRGAILRAIVWSLAVHSGWIVLREKDFEQFLIADLRGIECDIYRFRIARRAGTDKLIGWIWLGAPAITRLGILHPFDFEEDFLGMPKATHREGGVLRSRIRIHSDEFRSIAFGRAGDG